MRTTDTTTSGAPSMSPSTPPHRAEALRNLDLVFPEIRAALGDAEIHEALVAAEVQTGSASLALHFIVAGHLWFKYWEKLLVTAVGARLQRLGASGAVSERQVFEVASRLPPPRPKSESDGVCWMDFADAVTRDLLPTIKATAESAKDPEVERRAEEARARQEAFTQEFRNRLAARSKSPS